MDLEEVTTNIPYNVETTPGQDNSEENIYENLVKIERIRQPNTNEVNPDIRDFTRDPSE